MMKKAAMSEKRLITAFLLCRQTGIDVLRQPSGSACLLLYITAAPAFRKLQKLRIFSALYSST